jgi:hypothetical protein
MEKSITGIDKPVSVKGFTIIPVWEIHSHYSTAAGIAITSTKQATAVVIVSPSTRKAFKISGEEIPLEKLLQEVPDIKEALVKA